MKFATVAIALLGAAQADYQNNADGTQINFDKDKRYTLYSDWGWEHCQSRQFQTESEAMNAYYSTHKWKILFDGDRIMEVF